MKFYLFHRVEFGVYEWDFWVFVEIPRVNSGIYHKHHELKPKQMQKYA